MATVVVNQGGANPTLQAGMTAANPGDTISIQGAWTVADTTAVTWNKAVNVIADASSKHPGRPWQAGDTHYRHRSNAQDSFVVSANVDIVDLDIQNTSGGVSDEVFDLGNTSSDITLRRCLVGFAANVDQQDVFYSSGISGAMAVLFEQCMFYNVGRAVIDFINHSGDLTVDFNSISSYSMMSHNGRNDGGYVGLATSGTPTITVNMHNCLLHTPLVTTSRVVGSSASGVVTLNADRTSVPYGNADIWTNPNVDVENIGPNVVYNAVFVDTAPAAGQAYVTSIAGDYNLLLQSDANNVAQDNHAQATGPLSGLTIPATDVLGGVRPYDATTSTLYDLGFHEVGSSPPITGGYKPLLQNGNLGNDLYDGTIL